MLTTKLKCPEPDCIATTGFYPVMEWQGLPYVGGDVVIGIECADCAAEWDMMGNQTYAYAGVPIRNGNA
jgi:hypothetical protein